MNKSLVTNKAPGIEEIRRVIAPGMLSKQQLVQKAVELDKRREKNGPLTASVTATAGLHFLACIPGVLLFGPVYLALAFSIGLVVAFSVLVVVDLLFSQMGLGRKLELSKLEQKSRAFVDAHVDKQTGETRVALKNREGSMWFQKSFSLDDEENMADYILSLKANLQEAQWSEKESRLEKNIEIEQRKSLVKSLLD